MQEDRAWLVISSMECKCTVKGSQWSGHVSTIYVRSSNHNDHKYKSTLQRRPVIGEWAKSVKILTRNIFTEGFSIKIDSYRFVFTIDNLTVYSFFQNYAINVHTACDKISCDRIVYSIIFCQKFRTFIVMCQASTWPAKENKLSTQIRRVVVEVVVIVDIYIFLECCSICIRKCSFCCSVREV